VTSAVGTERLVVDTGVALTASGSAAARRNLERFRLAAPPLLWSEVHSAAREAVWREEITPQRAQDLLAAFARLGVHREQPAALYTTAVAIAEELGWAKTYDAEYLALARLRGGKVVTIDARLLRRAARTGLVTDVAALLER
jgi:predicted nucleic acid-binding protein